MRFLMWQYMELIEFRVGFALPTFTGCENLPEVFLGHKGARSRMEEINAISTEWRVPVSSDQNLRRKNSLMARRCKCSSFSSANTKQYKTKENHEYRRSSKKAGRTL